MKRVTSARAIASSEQAGFEWFTFVGCASLLDPGHFRRVHCLPEQYYSLTWFLSPVFGLLLSPPLGSASDRCTLRWGRRRPFILLLGIGALLGVALFLNCSKIGMLLSGDGDDQGEGGVAAIVVALLGVIIMDFCLDASEGPIRAYLLDVAETSEQDEALSIHSFAGGRMGWKFLLLFYFISLFFVIFLIYIFNVSWENRNSGCEYNVVINYNKSKNCFAIHVPNWSQ
uniref:Uncharacterized protein n=1 Tax=Eptatretus burgeri TaxID=7764 RepID=A0A8C4QB03_EPTBU